jgi:D-alanyl-D-alanine carboxypeptidase (penicillin-binding protein 5/6)
MPWPRGVQATVDIPGIGSFGQHGPSAPAPIGSVTKMMTALLVLKAHPLGLYQSGPDLTVTAHDVREYQADAKTHQSVMPVILGEKLSERQLLEGLLVGSGNNVAHMLADWIQPRPGQFVTMMNREAQKLGLHHTHYAGPSGLNPATVSTAEDQMKLAEYAMKIPVFRQIVSMPAMTVPGQNRLEYNYNYVVGHDGITGVKTGSTVQAGGCFIFSAQKTVAGVTRTIYGGVVGQFGTPSVPQLQLALDDGVKLANAAAKAVHQIRLWNPGQTVAQVSVPWGSPVGVTVARAVAVDGWGHMPYRIQFHFLPLKPQSMPARSVVGRMIVTVGQQSVSTPLVLESSVTSPPWRWRLLR